MRFWEGKNIMAKKSFKDNPAFQFISAMEDKQETLPVRKTTKAPHGYKLNPLYIETKTRRLQLVLQPSLFERVKKMAYKNGLSVNEYVHRVLDQATKDELEN